MCPTGTGTSYRPTPSGGASNLRSAFDVLDADHDGKISPADLKTFYTTTTVASSSSSSSSQNDDVIGTMMSVADSNNDGYVEYDEFERVLDGRGKDNGMRIMEEAFKVMDRDGDGKVGHGDLKSYLGWAGFEASDEDIKAMIRLGGGDENGGVTFDGLLKVLAFA